ncbi:MAG: hypothetical protein AB8G05_00890 [Oligoflexales bacterium]
MNAVIEEIDQVTLGYGRISGIERTIEINIDPKSIGKAAAYVSYKFFKENKKIVEIKENNGLKISRKSIQKLKLQIPVDLKKYVQP